MGTATAKLNVLISLASRMEKGKDVEEYLQKLTGGLLAAGAAMAVFAGKQSLQLGGQITDLSRQAEMGTDAFQTLAAAGAEAGVEMDKIAAASAKLRKNLQEARENGASPLNDALARLSLTAAGIQALAPERQWEEIGRAIVTAKDRQLALNAATELMGEKNLPKLLEVLERLGADGFDKLSKDLSGVRISREDLDTLDKAGDKLMFIWEQTRKIAAHTTAGAIRLVTSDAAAKARSNFGVWTMPKEIAARNGQLAAPTGAAAAGAAMARLDQETRATEAKQKSDAAAIAQRKLMTDAEAEAARALREKADVEENLAIKQAIKNAEGEAELQRMADEREARRIGTQLIEANRTALELYNAEMERLAKLMVAANPEERAAIDRAKISAKARLENATTVRDAENALTDEIQRLTAERAKLDGDFTLSESSKWAVRRKLIEDEIAAREKLSGVLKGQRDALTPGSTEYITADQTYRSNLSATEGPRNELADTGPNPNSFAEQMKAGAVSMTDSWGTASEGIADTLLNTIGAAVDSISSSISGLIFGTMSWGDALRNIGGTILNTFVNTIIQMGVQWVITQGLIKMGLVATKAVGSSLRAAEVVESNAAEAAKAPAIMANAAGASIGSFGIAAAIGIAALIAAMAAFGGGFEDGGWTGGKRGEFAGVVHGEEIVFSAPAVDALGRDNLLAMHADALKPAGSSPSRSSGSGSAGSGGISKQPVTLIIDHRETARIEDVLSNPLFEVTVQRIGDRSRGVSG